VSNPDNRYIVTVEIDREILDRHPHLRDEIKRRLQAEAAAEELGELDIVVSARGEGGFRVLAFPPENGYAGAVLSRLEDLGVDFTAEAILGTAMAHVTPGVESLRR
jgi:hypothetical protein